MVNDHCGASSRIDCHGVNLEEKKKRKKEKELVPSMINVDKIVPCDYRCSMARMTGYFAYGSETLARAHVLRLEPNYI